MKTEFGTRVIPEHTRHEPVPQSIQEDYENQPTHFSTIERFFDELFESVLKEELFDSEDEGISKDTALRNREGIKKLLHSLQSNAKEYQEKIDYIENRLKPMAVTLETEEFTTRLKNHDTRRTQIHNAIMSDVTALHRYAFNIIHNDEHPWHDIAVDVYKTYPLLPPAYLQDRKLVGSWARIEVLANQSHYGT